MIHYKLGHFAVPTEESKSSTFVAISFTVDFGCCYIFSAFQFDFLGLYRSWALTVKVKDRIPHSRYMMQMRKS
jgi:hypothetical protein